MAGTVLLAVSLAASCSSSAPSSEAKGAAQPEVNEWGCTVRGSQVDCRNAGPFAGRQIKDAEFSYANLVGVDFSGATLTNVRFSGALLSGADFSDAILDFVEFNEADLTETDFSGVDCRNCWFADLRGGRPANLTGAVLDGARFHGTDAYAGSATFAEVSLKGTSFESLGWEDAQFTAVVDATDADFSTSDADVQWKFTLKSVSTPWEGMTCPGGSQVSGVMEEDWGTRVEC